MLTFDKDYIANKIEQLPKRLRVAFAAACVQRQLPSYLRTSAANPTGDPEAVTRMLRELWDAVERNAFEPEKIRRDLALCDSLTPSHDTEWFPGAGFAQAALLSLAYAFDSALSGGSQESLLAAKCGADALDDYIIQNFRVDVAAPGAESFIGASPIMQAELSRQQVDLAELSAPARHRGSEAAVIARIKRRAERDSGSFFG
jgi:hypothetical protein